MLLFFRNAHFFFRLDPFNVCDYTMNINHQISKCYESVCTCASTSLDFDVDCRCSVLHNFAIKCLNSQPGVDISSWRLKFDCRELTLLFNKL